MQGKKTKKEVQFKINVKREYTFKPSVVYTPLHM